MAKNIQRIRARARGAKQFFLLTTKKCAKKTYLSYMRK